MSPGVALLLGAGIIVGAVILVRKREAEAAVKPKATLCGAASTAAGYGQYSGVCDYGLKVGGGAIAGVGGLFSSTDTSLADGLCKATRTC